MDYEASGELRDFWKERVVGCVMDHAWTTRGDKELCEV